MIDPLAQFSYFGTESKSEPFSTLNKKYLRVLLVKWPDIGEPTFFGQYLFVCIIKSTYHVDVHVTKTWDLRAKTVPWQAILDLGPRQK